MAKQFPVLGKTVVEDTLKLPIGDQVYTIHSPDAQTGLKVSQLFALAAAAAHGNEVTPGQVSALSFNDDEEKDFMEQVFTTELHERLMRELNWSQVQHVFQTSLVWIAYGEDAALQFWTKSSSDASDPTRPQDRRQKTRKK